MGTRVEIQLAEDGGNSAEVDREEWSVDSSPLASTRLNSKSPRISYIFNYGRVATLQTENNPRLFVTKLHKYVEKNADLLIQILREHRVCKNELSYGTHIQYR